MIPRSLRRPSAIPRGYDQVDPRTATRVPLGHELSGTNPVFDGDPPFAARVFATVPEAGYLVEQITSLGTHLGTHIDVPAHFVPGGARLSDLDESWTLMPLAVFDAPEPGRSITMDDVHAWERRWSPIPSGACVVLRTGHAQLFGTPEYSIQAAGFSADGVSWLFGTRRVRALGSDTFGPDTDSSFAATRTALEAGGVVLANLGPGLNRMRTHGDWISVNAPRPAFSGFPVGVTGFTVPAAAHRPPRADPATASPRPPTEAPPQGPSQ
ncbi:cyclase family protein [Kineosporia mesophila]|uniref:cyclase family protein n=1 Tax=Kineosporia mesophila TaxID=566012 RepID=UPI001E4DC2C6|nr:cyclase family protein [Kineosporia mesophila]